MRLLPRPEDVDRIRQHRERHTLLWLGTVVLLVLLFVVIGVLQGG